MSKTESCREYDEAVEVLVDLDTAYHEAGHLVAEVVLCLGENKPYKIDMVGDDDAMGRVSTRMALVSLAYLPAPYTLPVGMTEHCVMMMLAGSVSSSVKLGRLGGGGGSGDKAKARALLDSMYSPAERRLAIRRLRRKTKKFFAEPRVWAAVEYVATELLKKRTIEGDDFWALLEEIEKIAGVCRLFQVGHAVQESTGISAYTASPLASEDRLKYQVAWDSHVRQMGLSEHMLFRELHGAGAFKLAGRAFD